MRLLSLWTKNLPEDKKKDFENTLRNSTTVLSRLCEILQEEIDNLNNQEASSAQYDSPSWAYLQADRNGQRSALKKIRSLFNFI